MADQDTTLAFDFVKASQELQEGDRVEVTEETVAAPIHEAPATPTETPAETAPAESGTVLTKDGQHTMPYAEVAETRKQNADLRATVAKLTEQLVATTAQVRDMAARPASPNDVADATQKVADAAAEAQATGGNVEEAVEAALAEVIAEAPWMEPLRNALAPLAKTSARVQTIDARLAQLEQAAQAANAAAVKQTEQTVAEALAKVPIVAYWQANGAEGGTSREAFEYAAMIDKRLRETEEWKGKPMDERFKEVQKRVVGVLGLECVPEKLRAGVGAPVSSEQVLAAANARLAQAAGGTVTTLSDIPGGTPAAPSMAAELAADDVPLNRLEQHFQSQRNPIDAFQQALRTLN